jgi:hypothetical protein
MKAVLRERVGSITLHDHGLVRSRLRLAGAVRTGLNYEAVPTDFNPNRAPLVRGPKISLNRRILHTRIPNESSRTTD